MQAASSSLTVRSPGALMAAGFPRWQSVPAAVTTLELSDDDGEEQEDDVVEAVQDEPARRAPAGAIIVEDPLEAVPTIAVSDPPVARRAAITVEDPPEIDDPPRFPPNSGAGRIEQLLRRGAAAAHPVHIGATSGGGWVGRRLRGEAALGCLDADEGQKWVYPALSGTSAGGSTSSTSSGGSNSSLLETNSSSSAASLGVASSSPIGDSEDNEAEDGEAPGDASRFATFRRSALVAGGRDHPDPLCEPHAVRDTQPEPLGPEDDIRVPRRVVDRGFLSSTQLEAVALAARRFRRRLPGGARAGFLLGDGTGCGKGRCIAALILDSWNRGSRRHIWISATADLYSDAIRDLRDLGADIPCCSLSRVKAYGALDTLPGNAEVRKLGPRCEGVLFLTYAMLVSAKSKGLDSHSDPNSSRYGQVLRWLTMRSADEAGDGLICFDEAHKAKNLEQNTKVARLVDELQRSCPGCAVLYASATAATEVGHMQFMARLGLWGDGAALPQEDNDAAIGEQPPFEDFERFRNLVLKGGMPAMELVAVQLKSMGALACRSLAFEGTSFDLATVHLSAAARKQYDDSCELWRDMRRMMELACDQGVAKKTLRAEFWAAQQRFFKGLVVAAKVPDAVRLTNEALHRGEAVVISLWTTNESVTTRAATAQAADGDDDADGFASGPELTVETFLDRHFPTVDASGAAITWAVEAINGFKARLRSLSLPPNPIDELTDRLGGSQAVAEMSGRSHRQVIDALTGEVRSEPRRGPSKRPKAAGGGLGGGGESVVDSVNIAEQRAFQSGTKNIAIITEAASAGISLHSDRREIAAGTPPRPRRMLSLELPWAADKAVQQLGRVHRSNQVHPPAFTCVVSDIGGEARFVSAVTRRLRQLGAMTRGDRQAGLGTSGDAFGFGKLDLMSGPYGPKALACVLQDISRQSTVLPPPSGGWLGGNFREFAMAAKMELEEQELVVQESSALKKGGLKRFLNRLLGVSAAVQAGLISFLSAHVTRLEDSDREAGILDEGVVSLNQNGRFGRLRSVEEISSEPLCIVRGRELSLRRLRLDRGLPWEAAEAMLNAARVDDAGCQGVYMRPLDHASSEPLIVIRRQARLGQAVYVLHYPHVPSTALLDGLVCTAARLQGSRLLRCETREELGEAERAWREQYNKSEKECIHVQRHRVCHKAGCFAGKRCFEETLLTGQILAQWDLIAATLGGLNRSPLVRTQLRDGRVLIGLLLPPGAEDGLRDAVERREVADRQRAMEAATRARQQLQQQKAATLDDDDAEDGSVDILSDVDSGNGGHNGSAVLGGDSDGSDGGGISVTRVAPPAWAREPDAKRPRFAQQPLLVVDDGDDDDVVAVGAPGSGGGPLRPQLAPAAFHSVSVIDVPPAPMMSAGRPSQTGPGGGGAAVGVPLFGPRSRDAEQLDRVFQAARPLTSVAASGLATQGGGGDSRSSELAARRLEAKARWKSRHSTAPAVPAPPPPGGAPGLPLPQQQAPTTSAEAPPPPAPEAAAVSAEEVGAAVAGTTEGVAASVKPLDRIEAPPKYMNEVWQRANRSAPKYTPHWTSDFYMRSDL